MSFIVGDDNKCHIYRSVGESEVYICIIMLYMFKHFMDMNYNIKPHFLCVTATNVIFIFQKLLYLKKI